MIIHRCGKDGREAYRSLPATARDLHAGDKPVRLSGQLVDPPSSLRCRPPFQSKRHCPKLTVFRPAANSSVAFRWRSLRRHDGRRVGHYAVPAERVCDRCRSHFGDEMRSVGSRCGMRGLTRRSLISTLKQSPESRRYGCDPDELSGDRAGQQCEAPRPTCGPTQLKSMAAGG